MLEQQKTAHGNRARSTAPMTRGSQFVSVVGAREPTGVIGVCELTLPLGKYDNGAGAVGAVRVDEDPLEDDGGLRPEVTVAREARARGQLDESRSGGASGSKVAKIRPAWLSSWATEIKPYFRRSSSS